MKDWRIIICSIIILFSSNLKAKEGRLEIDDLNSCYNPALHSSYLEDHENALKIHDILSPEYQNRFIPNTHKIPNFGVAQSSIWLKFSVKNQLDTSPYLEIDNPALDTIEYYLINKENILVHQSKTGNHLKIDKRNIRSGDLMLDLNLKDNDIYTCYLKINSKSSSMLVPLSIASLKIFLEVKHSESVWQGIYFGLILFLVIYNFFLFTSLKDSTYIYFALFITSMGLLFALFKGLGMQYIWNEFPMTNQFTPLIGAAAGIFMILFSSKFLDSKVKTPKLHKLLTLIIGIYCTIMVLNLLNFQYLSTNLVILNSTLGLFFLMFIAVKAWKDGYEPAKFYLLSWSFYVVGVFISFLRDNNFVEVNTIIGNILQITSIMSILFMSFALSKKINIYIAKRDEAQKQALATAIENEKLISNQNQLLEASVHQRTIDLEQTIITLRKQHQDLKEANRFKDKVFSIISHDLKSPISTLAGMLGLMKLKSIDELERGQIVDKLEITLKSTKNLLDNILAWANKNNKHSKKSVEIELHVVVEEIRELFQYPAMDKGISLKNTIEPNFFINVNKDMLQLVLRNLVSNAVKFTPKKGAVTISMKEEYQDLLIEVKDNGMGMSNDIKTNLFKSNQHTSTRGTENEKGTGLGLLLCKEFVDKFNGELNVTSEPGKGSTFTIALKNVIPVVESVVAFA